MEAIETRALTRCYDGKAVVDALSLRVHEGEVFALLGVNGAGKSTTIRMLTGLTAPTAGEATVCGADIREELPALRRVVGLCPQETAVARKLTVRENVELMARLHSGAKTDAVRQAQTLLARFSLCDVAETRAGKLSGGWQRRTSIAMALAARPRVLFLDEPTAGLDVLARRALWDVLRQTRGEMTIVLTTHYMEEAEALSDRIAIMAHGQLRAVGTAAELKAKTGGATLEDAFIALAREGGTS